MSINSRLLKKCINDCYQNFCSYYDLIYKNAVTFSKLLKDPENRSIFEKIQQQEEKTNTLDQKSRQEIEWYICQQTPTANNLRFFLTVSISLKDLERCGDYIYSISSILFYGNNSIKKFFRNFYIWDFLLEDISKMWELFLKHPTKIETLSFLEIKKIKLQFQEKLRSFYEDINVELWKKITSSTVLEDDDQEIKTSVFEVYKIMVKIDRIIDHIFNISENFYLIDHLTPCQ